MKSIPLAAVLLCGAGTLLGALQAAHAVAAAHRSREERAAKEEVARALAAFLSAPKP